MKIELAMPEERLDGELKMEMPLEILFDQQRALLLEHMQVPGDARNIFATGRQVVRIVEHPPKPEKIRPRMIGPARSSLSPDSLSCSNFLFFKRFADMLSRSDSELAIQFSD